MRSSFPYVLLLPAAMAVSATAQSLDGYWDNRFCPCGMNWSILTFAKDGNTVYLGGGNTASLVTFKTHLGPVHISITDMLGRKVASLTSTDNEVRFNVSELPAGIYNCLLETQSGKMERKFIVVK